MSNNENSGFDLKSINSASHTSTIKYNPDRTIYAIDDHELNQLTGIGLSIWKEVFFASLGLAIPTLINAIASSEQKTNDSIMSEYFLNVLGFVVSILFLIVSAILWASNAKSKKKLINNIKNKPSYKL